MRKSDYQYEVFQEGHNLANINNVCFIKAVKNALFGKPPPAPDYTQLANASKEGMEMMVGLGDRQLEFAQQQYMDMLPIAQETAAHQREVANIQLDLMRQGMGQADAQFAAQQQVMQQALQQEAQANQMQFDLQNRAIGIQDQANRAQQELMGRGLDQNDRFMGIQENAIGRALDMQEETAAQGREFHQHWQDHFKPLEQKTVADAAAYNTQAEFERQASQAAADVAQRAAVERAVNERQMASMGVNPNSGRFQAQQNTSSLQAAALGAGAMNQARRSAEMTGYARQMDAVGLGRGLPGASAGAYGLAAQNAGNAMQGAGNSGVAGMNLAGNMAAAMGSGAGAQNQNFSGASGLSGIIGALGSGGSSALNAGISAGNASGNMMGASMGTMMQPGNNFLAGMGQSANTMGAGHNLRISGLAGMLGGQAQMYNGHQQMVGQGMQALGLAAGLLSGGA